MLLTARSCSDSRTNNERRSNGFSTSFTTTALLIISSSFLKPTIAASATDFSITGDSILSGSEVKLPFVNASGSTVTEGWDLRTIEESQRIQWTWNAAVAALPKGYDTSNTISPNYTAPGDGSGDKSWESSSGRNGKTSNETILRQYWVETSPTQDFQSPNLTWIGCAVFLQEWKNSKNRNAEGNRNDCSRLVSRPCQMSIRGSLGDVVQSQAQTTSTFSTEGICDSIMQWFATQYPEECSGFGRVQVTGLIGPGISDKADAGHGGLNRNAVLSEVVSSSSYSYSSSPSTPQSSPTPPSSSSPHIHQSLYDEVTNDSTMILTVLFSNLTTWRASTHNSNEQRPEPVVDMACLAPNKISRGSRTPDPIPNLASSPFGGVSWVTLAAGILGMVFLIS